MGCGEHDQRQPRLARGDHVQLVAAADHLRQPPDLAAGQDLRHQRSSDSTKAIKKIETFGLADAPPSTSINGPNGNVIPTTTFIMTGTASDDFGVNAINISVRDAQNRYLQDDGTASSNYNTLRTEPDVVGATAATWSLEVTVPYEGVWKAEAIAVDTIGQSDLRGGTNEWLVSATAVAPTVTVTAPVVMTPPTAAFPITIAPGSPITFSGTSSDDEGLKNVEITLRNNTTAPHARQRRHVERRQPVRLVPDLAASTSPALPTTGPTRRRSPSSRAATASR